MQNPTKAKVLFLDDDADTRELVSFTLEQANIDVVLASNAADAWKLATTDNFDLYLLDGLVPDGDGFELCRNLRRHSPSKPIVFYTGLAFKADIQKGIEAGAKRYIVKPFYGDLAETILQTIAGEYSQHEAEKRPEPSVSPTNRIGRGFPRSASGII